MAFQLARGCPRPWLIAVALTQSVLWGACTPDAGSSGMDAAGEDSVAGVFRRPLDSLGDFHLSSEEDAGPGDHHTPDLSTDLASVDTTDIFSCPDGLSAWPEHDICAPKVDPCPEPWKMPLIGGGCQVVGPRACPEDGECDPEEPLPCPEGFEETSDGVACIPIFDACEGGVVPHAWRSPGPAAFAPNRRGLNWGSDQTVSVRCCRREA